jgi:hypothetical protein
MFSMIRRDCLVNLKMPIFHRDISLSKRCDLFKFSPKIRHSENRFKVYVGLNHPVHPFSNCITQENAKKVMSNYLAMSEAFPYIQAAAANSVLEKAIITNQPINENMAKMFAVGAFLSWDEVGGHYLMMSEGKKSLEKILNIKKQFHSKLLEKDLEVLFSEKIKPDYSGPTKDYLFRLRSSLGSTDEIHRCAALIAFELHAGQMIEALWNSLGRIYKIDKDRLTYFRIHVGGDEPAEIYHQKMTEALMNQIVPIRKVDLFFSKFTDEYVRHIKWAEKITNERRKS